MSRLFMPSLRIELQPDYISRIRDVTFVYTH